MRNWRRSHRRCVPVLTCLWSDMRFTPRPRNGSHAWIARQINRSRGAVRARRNILGIPALNVIYSRPWTAEEEAELGIVPDRVLAKRLKRTFIAVQARREIKHQLAVGAQRHQF